MTTRILVAAIAVAVAGCADSFAPGVQAPEVGPPHSPCDVVVAEDGGHSIELTPSTASTGWSLVHVRFEDADLGKGVQFNGAWDADSEAVLLAGFIVGHPQQYVPALASSSQHQLRPAAGTEFIWHADGVHGFVVATMGRLDSPAWAFSVQGQGDVSCQQGEGANVWTLDAADVAHWQQAVPPGWVHIQRLDDMAIQNFEAFAADVQMPSGARTVEASLRAPNGGYGPLVASWGSFDSQAGDLRLSLTGASVTDRFVVSSLPWQLEDAASLYCGATAQPCREPPI